MADKDRGKSSNECVLEIRYKPNARILDFRGSWAEIISSHMGFPEWRIVENRADIVSKDGKSRCFVGFRNSGFVTRDSPTANYFPDQASKFFRFLLSLDGFANPLLVERIGVRAKFITPHFGNFEDLLQRYTTRYLRLTESAEKALGAKLVDIGGNLNFADKHGNFNTVSGPMIQEQSSQYFDWADDLPLVGLYYDIDYWLKPNKELTDAEVLKTISSFSKESWERHIQIQQIILGS